MVIKRVAAIWCVLMALVALGACGSEGSSGGSGEGGGDRGERSVSSARIAEMDERLKDAYVRGPNPQSLEAEGLAYNLRQTAKNSREYTAGLEQDLAQARKEAAKTAELIETYEAEGRELDMFAPECDLLLGPGNYDPSPFLVEQGVELQSDLVNADETITQLNGVISEAEELPEAAQKELEYLDNAKEAREEVRTSRKAAVEAHDNYLETHESYLEQIPVIQEEQMALYDTTECF